MASIFRTLMRSIRKRQGQAAPSVNVGTVRAGMHQAAEHEFRRSRMAEGVPTPETAENALDMPAPLEAEIPPVEEEDDEEVAEIAENDAAIMPEEEILEDVADPEASVNEEEEGGTVNDQMSVDYSAERIPEITGPGGGGNADPSTPLEYTPQDGSLKEIQEPLPGLGEKLGIPPVINGVIDPSANVADFEPDPESEIEPVEPGE